MSNKMCIYFLFLDINLIDELFINSFRLVIASRNRKR